MVVQNIRNHFTGHNFLPVDPMVVTSQIPAATGTHKKRKGNNSHGSYFNQKNEYV
jgi:hypothetical protein